MALQLIITGDHTTDLLAELQQLSHALNGETDRDPNQRELPLRPQVHSEKTEEGVTHTIALENTEIPSEEAPKKLTRKEQDDAVKKMIGEGEIIVDLYDQLTKGRKKKIDDALAAAKAGVDAPEEGDALPETATPGAPNEVTADDLRALMGRLSKDEDGNSNQDMLLEIRECIVKAIPEGEETKVGNVPEAGMAALYAAIEALEV